MAQRVDRVQVRRLEGGEKPEEDADRHGEYDCNHDGGEADRDGGGGHAGDDLGKADARADADDAAHAREHGRLSQELPQDAALFRADRLLQADLPRALRDGDEHDVHDADAADEQRDAGDPDQLAVRRVAEVLQLLGLLQQVLRLILDAGRLRDLRVENVGHRLTGVRHGLGARDADRNALRFVKGIDGGPHGARDKDACRGAVRVVRVILLDGIDHRLELRILLDDADDRKGELVDFDRFADGIVAVEQGVRRAGVDDRDRAERGEIAVDEAAPVLQNQAVRRKVTVVHAENLRSGDAVVAVIHAAVVIGAARVERRVLDVFHVPNALQRFLGADRNAGRQAVVQDLIRVVALIQLDLHRVGAGADQVFLDLLVCAFDRRDDRNDRGDADDDAEHRQEGAHFVRPDALKGEPDVLNHSAATSSSPSMASSGRLAFAPSIACVP